MKVTVNVDTANKLTTIVGTPGEYDAIPVADIRLWGVPFTRHLDREAVAAALLFHDQASGELRFDGDAGCSRHVAREITRFFAPVDIVVVPQSLTPIAHETGTVIATMPIRPSGAGSEHSTAGSGLILRFLMGGVGSTFSDGEIVIGTNLPTGRVAADDVTRDLLRLVGAALYFAGDLQLRQLRVDADLSTVPSLERLMAAQRLLGVVGIGLSWVDG